MTRRQLEDWIDRAIAALDSIDGDADFEAEPDCEPEPDEANDATPFQPFPIKIEEVRYAGA